jgi:hypothetical protein
VEAGMVEFEAEELDDTADEACSYS